MTNSELKALQGYACLSNYLDGARQGVFLKRNQAKFLKHVQNMAVAGNETKRPSPQEIDSFEYPSKEVIQKYQERVAGAPFLTVKIKELLSNSNGKSSRQQKQKKRPRFRDIPCFVEVTIRKLTSEAYTEPTFKFRQEGQMRIRGISEDLSIEIISNPLVINAAQHQVSIDRGATWSMSIPDAYSIELALMLKNDRDAADLLSFIGNDNLNNTSPPFRSIAATWGDLPRCPKQRIGLPLYGVANNQRIKLNCSMYVDMGWKEVEKSVLQAHSSSQRKIRDRLQLPPSPISESSIARHNFRVIYKLPTNVQIDFDACKCLFCNHLDLNDLSLLRFHLICYHSNVKFACESRTMAKNGFDSIHALISIKEISSLNIKPSNFAWISPGFESFNLEKFIDGDERWIAKGMMVEKKHNVQKSNVIPAKAKTNVRKLPDQVQPIPKARRKRYPVPKAGEGVIFFRSISKRIMEEGELLSESDDEIDLHWLTSKREKAIQHLEITAAAKKFLRLFDRYFEKERLNGDLYVGDTLKRFIDEKGSEFLRDSALSDEFRKKVTELYEDNIITEPVMRFCQTAASKALEPRFRACRHSKSSESRLLKLSRSPCTPPESPANSVCEGSTAISQLSIQDVEMTNTENYSETSLDHGSTVARSGPLVVKDKCKCGKMVENMREAIFCENQASQVDALSLISSVH